ncbi:MAG: hypothetical protein GX913_00515 [Clostridiales bacterium]|nr:hypothetical protein [Clostridiales bacterium]
MIRIGSIVMVRPTSTLKFPKRWGKVVNIIPGDGLPIKVKFSTSNIIYGFTLEELMTGKEVKEWDSLSFMNICYKCGVDLTGQYTTICDECAFPLPKDGG